MNSRFAKKRLSVNPLDKHGVSLPLNLKDPYGCTAVLLKASTAAYKISARYRRHSHPLVPEFLQDKHAQAWLEFSCRLHDAYKSALCVLNPDRL